ncbi:MAG: hypothetical protein ACLRMZ_05465 [Blautia marasmi]
MYSSTPVKEVLQQFTTGVFGALVFIRTTIGAIISVYLMADKEGFLTQGKMFSTLPLMRRGPMTSSEDAVCE